MKIIKILSFSGKTEGDKISPYSSEYNPPDSESVIRDTNFKEPNLLGRPDNHLPKKSKPIKVGFQGKPEGGAPPQDRPLPMFSRPEDMPEPKIQGDERYLASRDKEIPISAENKPYSLNPESYERLGVFYDDNGGVK